MSDYINIKYYIHTYIYIYISRSAHLPSPEILVNPLPRQNSTFQPHALGHGEQLGWGMIRLGTQLATGG